MDLPFKNSVSDNESGKIMSGKEKKIDTEPKNDEEAAEQEKGLLAINNFNDKISDTPEDEDDSDNDDDSSDADDDKEGEDDEKDDDDESDSEESDEESDEEGEDDENADTAVSDEPKWKKAGFESADAYIDHLENNPPKKEDDSDKDLSEPEIQKKSFMDVFDKHKDVLPESAKENYLKFYQTQENAFLAIDPALWKLVNTLDKIKETLPFKERLEAAFQLAFPDKINKLAQKRGEVTAEIRAQKVNKAVSSSVSASSGKSSSNRYTAEQSEMAKRMGVKLPK